MRNPVADMGSVVIIDHFRAPKCERCAGNRGLEMQLQSGQPIFAVSDGVISYHGEVGRTKYLVLLTDNNRRITYGKIAQSTLRRGDRVLAGQQIATSGPNLYFGVREVTGSAVRYIDPLTYLTAARGVQGRAVLISGASVFWTRPSTGQIAGNPQC